MASRAQLVGTRLALVGTVLYLTEWLVIPFVPELPTDEFGDDAAAIAAEGTPLLLLAASATLTE